MFTFTITVLNRKPLNQRVISLHPECTFDTLAHIICELFGFSGEHLREFRVDDQLIINHPLYQVDESMSIEFNDPEFGDLQGIITNKAGDKTTLQDVFTNHTTMEFIYDFGDERRFEVRFTQANNLSHKSHKIIEKTYELISTQGTYLLEDCGGPDMLREYLDQYAHQKRDGDLRETWEDFAERIQPALCTYKK
ncbi:MAG TPA: hypothetical protein PLW93_02065 [Candidatus Absconditabacterales bacterium]|nr:hypothetical protein [Candidatus Absconditabacterales bacterium]HNG97035.1 hypothetical protein [Candidatus Absconditabacterales bacterium]